MNLLDDVKRMKGEGRSDREIEQLMLARGVSARDLDKAFSQSEIKAAVSGNGGDKNVERAPSPESQLREDSYGQNFGDRGGETLGEGSSQEGGAQEIRGSERMQPSLMSQQQETLGELPESDLNSNMEGGGYYSEQDGYGGQGYSNDGYNQGYGADIITEISEQVVDEKLFNVNESLKKVLNLGSNLNTRVEGLDERVKRIEKVMDRLQDSVLQKVGDYISDVSDLKKELIETQKSFKSVNKKRKKK
jgi:hypothetical protein